MNERGIKWFLWLFYWPVLIPMFFFSWLFPQSEEEAKKSEAEAKIRRTAETDSLLFEGERTRRF